MLQHHPLVMSELDYRPLVVESDAFVGLFAHLVAAKVEVVFGLMWNLDSLVCHAVIAEPFAGVVAEVYVWAHDDQAAAQFFAAFGAFWLVLAYGEFEVIGVSVVFVALELVFVSDLVEVLGVFHVFWLFLEGLVLVRGFGGLAIAAFLEGRKYSYELG